MSTTCLHCGAMTTNGLYLCDLAIRFARECLESAPIHFRNLSRQRRGGRPNGSISGGHFDQGGSASAGLALGRAENDISTWARTLADDRGIELPSRETEAETFTAICALLDQRLTTIATLEWCGQFVRDLARIEQALSAVSVELVPGWYAGQCRQETGRDMEGNMHTCGTPTYVMPGVTWVQCRGCGARTYARDHLAIVLEDAADWVATPKRLAEAIVALVDGEESVPRLRERIAQWSSRGALPAYQRSKLDHVYDFEAKEIVLAEVKVGPKRHRFGDVMDELNTRSKRAETARAKPA